MSVTLRPECFTLLVLHIKRFSEKLIRLSNLVDGYNVNRHEICRAAHLKLLVNLEAGLIESVPRVLNLYQLKLGIDVMGSRHGPNHLVPLAYTTRRSTLVASFNSIRRRIADATG